MKIRIVYLQITSWVGTSAIGAQHTYGSLLWDKAKPEGCSYYNTYELRREMTAKEIKEANAERIAEGLSGCLVQKGETTRGFYSTEEVIAAGKAAAAKLFAKNSYVLIQGDHGCCSAMPVLAWPDKFAKEGQRMNELGQEWERIGGYGYTWSKKDPERDARAEELDDEWQKLLEKITKS